MSGFTQGVVQAVSGNQRPYQTRYGMRYNLRFKMPDGQWYVLKFCKPEEAPPIHKGSNVSFSFDVDSSRFNQQTGQQIIENVVNQKSLQTNGGQQDMYGNQGGYQQPQGGGYQNGGYQQPQQGGYQNQPPPQQQQPQGSQHNWAGKEGMATGMALQAAANLLPEGADMAQLSAVAARILLLQDWMIRGMIQGGEDFLKKTAGSAEKAQAPQQEQRPDVPPMNQQQAPTAPPAQQPQGQNGNPASGLPAGFDEPPPSY